MTHSRNHILLISSWYPNRNNPTHGIFNKAFAEAAALYNKVSVLHVCSDEHLSEEFETVFSKEGELETLIVYYKKVKAGIPVFSQLKKRSRFIKAFETGYRQLTAKAGIPDLVQLNVVMPAGLGVYSITEKYGLPYVINEGWSGYCPEDGSYKGILTKYFTKKIVAKAKVIMPVSEHLKKAMLAHGLNGEYRIVPNVVNTMLFDPANNTSHKHTRFIHISTLDDVQKNVSGIIRAFGRAQEQSPAMGLTIVGDGESRPELRKLVHRLKLDEKIKFTGRLLGRDLAEALNSSDALVMFSNYETFCLTAAEALACGKPVITSRAGGLTDHITPELGIAVGKRDETALANAMLDFGKNKTAYNPVMLRKFITDHYTPEKIGRQLTDVYNAVIPEKIKAPF